MSESQLRTAFREASADLGAISALLGFEEYPGVDALLRSITDLITARAAAPVVHRAAEQEWNCASCQDGALLPQYGVAPHDCFYKIGKPMGQSEVHATDAWPENFELDEESNGQCGTFHCPDCGPKFKAGKPIVTDYAAIEREHLGDPDKRTGIYAPAPQEVAETTQDIAQGDERPALLARIRELATLGVSYGLLADDQCSQIVAMIDGNAVMQPEERTAAAKPSRYEYRDTGPLETGDASDRQ